MSLPGASGTRNHGESSEERRSPPSAAADGFGSEEEEEEEEEDHRAPPRASAAAPAWGQDMESLLARIDEITEEQQQLHAQLKQHGLADLTDDADEKTTSILGKAGILAGSAHVQARGACSTRPSLAPTLHRPPGLCRRGAR